MPFDGTELGMFETHPLAKLDAVERLIAKEERWCKGKLRDSEGRHCLVGAMQAVEGRDVLQPIVLRAAREVGGSAICGSNFSTMTRITTHADVLRALRRARENIIAGMIEGGRHRSWREKFAQALRAMLSGSVAEVSAALLFAANGPRTAIAGPAAGCPKPQGDGHASAAREIGEVL